MNEIISATLNYPYDITFELIVLEFYYPSPSVWGAASHILAADIQPVEIVVPR